MRILAIPLMLLLAVCVALGQAKVEVKPSGEAEGDATTQQVKKVSDMRRVVHIHDPAKSVEAKEEVRYDEKGGIIVPDASKGIQLRSTTAKSADKSTEKVDTRTSNGPAPTKDLNSRPAHKRHKKGSDE